MLVHHHFLPLDNIRLAHLCGPLDQHLKTVEHALEVNISRRNEQFSIKGQAVRTRKTIALLEQLYTYSHQSISAELVQLTIAQTLSDTSVRNKKKIKTDIDATELPPCTSTALNTRYEALRARSPNQENYIKKIMTHDLCFGMGPAGTGKTFLAVACAVDALTRSSVQKIVLTRPAVEAGERLGYLPGDLSQKVDPYLRPLYDALHDLMGVERVNKAFERGQIEIAPLAFMRGRTLNHAFVILDEAQNTTTEQMKMFLTRIGFNTKVVVTGDTSQVDLPKNAVSGLVDAHRVLKNTKGIAFCNFVADDVMRHPLVARIVQAYAKDTT